MSGWNQMVDNNIYGKSSKDGKWDRIVSPRSTIRDPGESASEARVRFWIFKQKNHAYTPYIG